MSRQPSLCMLFEAIGPYSAIGHVALAQVNAALDAGWKVTAVAKRLDESLRGKVEWIRLPVPRRLFALQWLTARQCYQYAVGNRLCEFDIVHGHQPQIADLCDVFQCHFLTRAAYERNCLYDRSGWRGGIDSAQKWLVLHAEDRCYRHWNPKTSLLFNSALTRDEFARLYGMPPSEEVFLCPAPPVRPISAEERAAARRKFIGSADVAKPVIGFLGGLMERKGYRRVVAGLQGRDDLFLLVGGSYSEGYVAPGLEEHSRAVGSVEASEFYAACDVLVLASYFEPFGLVALEAAARGIPVIATKEVGALPHLLESGAGVQWDPAAEPLGQRVDELMANKEKFVVACRAWAQENSAAEHQRKLLRIYEQILSAKKPEASLPVEESAR